MAPNKGRDVSTGREFIADTRRWWNDARLDALNGEHGQGMSGWWDKSTDTPPTDPIRGKSPPPSRNVDRRNKIQSRNSTSCSVAVLQMSERFRKNAHWHLYIVPTPNVNRGKWLHRKSRWRAGKSRDETGNWTRLDQLTFLPSPDRASFAYYVGTLWTGFQAGTSFFSSLVSRK